MDLHGLFAIPLRRAPEKAALRFPDGDQEGVLSYRELFLENQALRRELHRETPEEIVGNSAAMLRVFDLIRKVAPTRSTVSRRVQSATTS